MRKVIYRTVISAVFLAPSLLLGFKMLELRRQLSIGSGQLDARQIDALFNEAGSGHLHIRTHRRLW
jgi:hypothetical protein